MKKVKFRLTDKAIDFGDMYKKINGIIPEVIKNIERVENEQLKDKKFPPIQEKEDGERT